MLGDQENSTKYMEENQKLNRVHRNLLLLLTLTIDISGWGKYHQEMLKSLKVWNESFLQDFPYFQGHDQCSKFDKSICRTSRQLTQGPPAIFQVLSTFQVNGVQQNHRLVTFFKGGRKH